MDARSHGRDRSPGQTTHERDQAAARLRVALAPGLEQGRDRFERRRTHGGPEGSGSSLDATVGPVKCPRTPSLRP